MGKKFWFGYISFFVFVFPLFFSYMGKFIWSPAMSTIALATGFTGWIIFILWTSFQTIGRPIKMQRNIRYLIKQGHLTQGKILEKNLLKINKDNRETIEIAVQFKNFSDTPVKYHFEFTDSKPHEKRYEQGSNINLRLSTKQQSPRVILADTKTLFSWKFGIFATSFVVVYMIATFIFHYALFSDGNGWRFITLWHPWVLTPFSGLFFFNIVTIFGKLFGDSQKTEEELLLYGKKTTATIQHTEQTGTYINEQPQIKYTLKFTDHAGQTRVVTLKKIVPLTRLHAVNTGTQNILYLPDNPEKITFID